MGKRTKSTAFLKECLSDSLLKRMQEKPFSKITVDEIAAGAGVNRSTWFRHYATKSDALSFKLVQQWNRWASDHALPACRYTIENGKDFFQFNYENREILRLIWEADQRSVIYDAFYQIMKPNFVDSAEECYQSRFLSYGMFGMLDEWMKRGFHESPEEMTRFFNSMIRSE